MFDVARSMISNSRFLMTSLSGSIVPKFVSFKIVNAKGINALQSF